MEGSWEPPPPPKKKTHTKQGNLYNILRFYSATTDTQNTTINEVEYKLQIEVLQQKVKKLFDKNKQLEKRVDALESTKLNHWNQ